MCGLQHRVPATNAREAVRADERARARAHHSRVVVLWAPQRARKRNDVVLPPSGSAVGRDARGEARGKIQVMAR